MQFSFLSAIAASKRWNHGDPDLITEQGLIQATKDAPFWAKEVRLGRMRSMNEEVYLQEFHFFGFVPNKEFASALFNFYEKQHTSFFWPLLASAVECGNIPLLEVFQTKRNCSVQSVFFEWMGFTEHTASPKTPRNPPPHPRALQWFAQDKTLHEPLSALNQGVLLRDYAIPMLSAFMPLWWDAANGVARQNAVRSITKDWCAMPDAFITQQSALTSALWMLAALNQADTDEHKHDPKGVYRKSPQSMELAAILQECTQLICERAQLSLGLVRTLAGRMTDADRQDPNLCAVTLFETTDAFGATETPPNAWQHRLPLRVAHQLQVQHNALRAGPLPMMLDMQAKRGNPWQIYSVAEPFVNKRPVNAMELPADLLDTNVTSSF